MCACEPAVAIEFVMIKTQLADELRMLRATPFNTFAHIQNYQSIAPVGKVGQAIFDLKIMQVATNNLALTGAGRNRCRYLIRNFPTSHFFRMLHIGEINNPHGTRSVVSEVNVMPVDERAVNATRYRFGVFRNWL